MLNCVGGSVDTGPKDFSNNYVNWNLLSTYFTFVFIVTFQFLHSILHLMNVWDSESPLRTGLGSNLYEWKMTSRVLTQRTDHTRSRLPKKYHILILDSLSLTYIFLKTLIFQWKWKDFSSNSKISLIKDYYIWYFSKSFEFLMKFCIFWHHLNHKMK